MIRRFTLAALAAALLSTAAHAALLQEKNLPLDAATQIAQQAVQMCTADRYNVTVTVVDRAGTVRTVMRSDNAGPHTVDASRRKAFTAVSMRMPTTRLVENIQKNPSAAQLAAIDGFLALGGGVPITVGGEIVGGVGVAGAPGGNLDEACALKAIEKVQAKLK